MSYEGFEQVLCANGHYEILDCHEDIEKYCCIKCNAKIVWTNSVDTTNCEHFGYIDMAKFIDSPIEYTTCNLGHMHCIKEQIYRIPTKEEAKAARTFMDPDSNTHPISEYDKIMEKFYPHDE